MKQSKDSRTSFSLALFHIFLGMITGYIYSWGSKSPIQIVNAIIMALAFFLTWIIFYIHGKESILELNSVMDFIVNVVCIGTGFGIATQVKELGFYQGIINLFPDILLLIGLLTLLGLVGGWLFLEVKRR